MNAHLGTLVVCGTLICLAGLGSGCATTGSEGQPSGANMKFRTTDNRNIEIGHSTAENGGRSFRNPHLEKCWVADGFTFSVYDTLYIAPTTSTAKFQEDEKEPHRIAQERLVSELVSLVRGRNLFTTVTASESEIKPGAKVLKMENTITEYSKGGGAARYWAGLYGGGQPALRIVGAVKDSGKEVFTYQARRSGVSAGARVAGVFMTDVDIQSQDIHSMVLDLTDFMAAIAGKYETR
jgi:hypothetical protein